MATWVSNGVDVGGSGSYVAGTQSVQFCHDNFAATGDTISVPIGTFTWNTGVTITKAITISGSNYTPNSNTNFSGSGPGAPTLNTIVSSNQPSILRTVWFQGTNTGTNIFRLTGIHFTNIAAAGGSTNWIYLEIDNGTGSTDQFRVDNCFFDGGSNIVLMVQCWGNGSGVIDHCTLQGGTASEMIHFNNTGSSSLGGWTDDITPGGPNMRFCEDCIFQQTGYATSTGQNGVSGFECFFGARTACRYCLFNFCQGDCHGNIQPNTRWLEFYNNRIFIPSTNTGNSTLIQFRGGSGVIYNNNLAPGSQGGVSSSGHFISIQFFTDQSQPPNGAAGPSGTTLSPAISGPQPAYGPGAGIFTNSTTGQGPNSSPVYVWNNDTNITVGVTLSGVSSPWNPSPLQINGTGANIFTSTTQPSSMIISQKASQIGGATYSYTPYIYPHPLTGLTTVSPILSGSVSVTGLLALSLSPVLSGSVRVTTILTPSFGTAWQGLTAFSDASLARTILGASSGIYPSPSNTYAALFSTIFGNQIKSGALEWGTVPYARQLIGTNGAGWTIAAYANGTGIVWNNTNQIIFPTVSGVTQLLNSLGFCDSLTGGNILFFIDLTSIVSVYSGLYVSLPPSNSVVFTTY